MDDMADLGIPHWRGIRIQFERRGKNRTAEPYEYTALPNYVWCWPSDDQFHLLGGIEHLSRTHIRLSTSQSGNGSLDQMRRFRDLADAKKAEADRIIGNRKAMAAYEAFDMGEAIQLLDPGFSDVLARYGGMVKRAHELYPRIRAELTIFGRTTTVEVDPLSVRRAV